MTSAVRKTDGSVRKTSAAVDAMLADLPMLDALLAGTSAMRVAGKTFLPQWPNEKEDSYKARLATATLHPVFKRTAIVMAAKPLSRAITFKDVPDSVQELFPKIDDEGNTLHSFVADLMLDAIGRGASGVLVDYPKKPRSIRTRAQEKAFGGRPYFVRYPPGTVLGWRTEKRAGKAMLTQLRLLEYVSEEDGSYGEKIVEQVRVLTPGAWEVWRKVENKDDEWFLFDEGTTSLKQIPFVFFYGTRTGFGTGESPLIELAWQNVEHWQSASDQQTILHVARVPILFMKGFGEKDKLTVGASSAIKTSNKDAEVKWVEHTGAAIESGRKELLDLEERMRATGAEMLVRRPGKVLAAQVNSEDDSQKCVLQRVVEIAEASLNECLALIGAWTGQAKTGELSLYKDFGVRTMAEATAQLLLDMNVAGKLSNETLFEELQRRDVISPDRKWADEKDKLPLPEPPH